jgi:photosystem II stability/assembly factor-like uncharacterized protein
VGTDFGINDSTDGGNLWRSNFDLEIVQVIAVDPTTPNTIYATVSRNGDANQPAGLFKSTDGGEKWNLINTGLPDTYRHEVISLAIDPVTPTTLYAGTDGGGMFKSTNGGENWSALNTGIDMINSDLFQLFFALAIDPATPTTLYTGTAIGVFKSTDGGGNWSAANAGLTNTGISTLAIDPATPTTLYAGTDGGVFKSTDSGGNWSAMNTGLPDTLIHIIAIDPTMPTTLYLGTTNGVFVIHQ